MNMNEFCYRGWQLRTSAIRNAVDSRRRTLSEAAGSMSDEERLDRDTANRIFRAKGSSGSEC